MRLFNQLLAEGSVTLAETGNEPEFTGRYLVLLDADAGDYATKAVEESGLHVMSATSEDGEIESAMVESADAVIFPALNVALVDASAKQIQHLAASTAQESPILAVEPERILRALETPTLDVAWTEEAGEVSPEYRRGYRQAIFDMMAEEAPETIRLPAGTEASQTKMTWGLQAIGLNDTTGTGSGIRVAVLDTGFYFGHPDFAGRSIHGESFISGETVDDVAGHGTHCIGTACGPRQSQRGTRYGIASDAEIYVGKVLNNQGRGSEGGILAGVDWAVRNGCHVVSMSLGSPVARNQPPSGIFERAARRALRRGTLIVAAAGNDSTRPSFVAPVSYPANCPSIIAVAALGSNLRVASFSNQGINPQGGEVDLAGPGVGVFSSWPEPRLYHSISGTSMATPHVAGAAALVAEATAKRGRDLWDDLISLCKSVGLPASDAGAGVVQVPPPPTAPPRVRGA